MHVTGDRPLAKLLFWSAWKTVCPEPYIDMRIEPGKAFTWRITYEFYQASKASASAVDRAPALASDAPLLHGDKTMNRRDAITSLSMAGGASLLPPGRSLAEALVPKLSAAYGQAVRGTGAGQDPRHQDHPDRAERHPPGRREGRDHRAGAGRLGLRDVHPALAGREDGASTSTCKPFLIGRNVDEIEDIWQSSYVSSYWRNGPVLFNAMSGVDIALWDIKGKRAGLPLYQLLGGKVRQGADCYFHASGASFDEVETQRQGRRWSAASATSACRSARPATPATARAARRPTTGSATEAIGPTNPRAIWEPAPYCRMLPKFFEHMRTTLGDEVELLHDVHERITLNQAINLCKALEPYRLFFLEDPFPPEENDHFRLLRQQTSIPIAMGELFNTQHEYLPLIKDRLIDFIRIHISQIGGLSPARKVAALSEFFGVRTAWHGPGDASPLAHAAQLAIELTSYNFGVHEGSSFPAQTQEVFVGCPEVKDGYMLAQERPGLGIEVNEAVAAKFPIPTRPAELRLLVGHDAAARRHGHPALSAGVSLRAWPIQCPVARR